MTSSKLLGLMLLTQARKQLAEQNAWLRCNHEIVVKEDSVFGDLRYEVETIEQYNQGSAQANLEREMLSAQVDLFLVNVGAV